MAVTPAPYTGTATGAKRALGWYSDSEINAPTSPPQVNPATASSYQQAANQFKANNWGPNQTANGLTGDQNLAAVINQPGNSVGKNPTDYIKGVLAQASKDNVANTAPPPPQKDVHITDVGGTNGTNNTSNGNTSNGNADLINSMYDNNYKSQLQKLQETRQIQQQGLNQQETGVNQNALQNLNNNDSLAAQQLKQLQEVMANNGVRGGDSITATIGNQTAQQNGANSINQDKMNQLTDIQQKRSLINNNASANDLALMQQLQATRSGQMIDNNNTQDQRAIQLAQLMGTYNGQNTMQQNQNNFSNGIDLAGLTGQYNGKQTMQAQNQNFNQNLQTNQYNQGVKNDAFNQGMANKQFDYQKVQDDIKNGQWSTTTENQMKQWAEGNKLNWAQFNQQTKQALAQLAISQQNANTSAYSASNSAANQANDNALQRAKFNYDTDVNNIDNKYKQSQIDKNTADAQKQGLDDAYYKAVGLAQKDPNWVGMTPEKQTALITTHYDNLKPKSNGPSDGDISQYLKK